jgi:uncharacterized protein YndB with AHSA1/START domain
MRTTRVSRIVRATRSAVYNALVDPAAVQQWMVPDGMTSEVHSFDPREGDGFRISLTYDAPTDAGKSDAQTDTLHGRFLRLVLDREVVQTVEFETADPVLQGEMTITYTLTDAEGGGTEVVGVHENVPAGVRLEDNELGWTISLGKLAQLLET